MVVNEYVVVCCQHGVLTAQCCVVWMPGSSISPTRTSWILNGSYSSCGWYMYLVTHAHVHTHTHSCIWFPASCKKESQSNLNYRVCGITLNRLSSITIVSKNTYPVRTEHALSENTYCTSGLDTYCTYCTSRAGEPMYLIWKSLNCSVCTACWM